MKDTVMQEEYIKPRLALMGEFSAGKSTLSNLLLGADPMPVKITATRLPPVWISYGESAAERIDLDGDAHEFDIADLADIVLEETQLIRLQMTSDILKLCDLIDMPGISDPNMRPDVWRGVIGEADHVIWCTHATQAWRQSEAATWEGLPEELRSKSLLLLTRFDKLLTPRDRERVMERVRRETRGLFHKAFPVSLTQALSAGDDSQIWDQSGAEPFVKCLVDLLMKQGSAALENRRAIDRAPVTAQIDPVSRVHVMPSRVRAKPGSQRRSRRAPLSGTGQIGKTQLAEVPGNV
ncbi:MAG: dynamin family protein [Rhodobacteraceae bacterium]|nr:dynamin family protein [Paracoccaceae bacterium]